MQVCTMEQFSHDLTLALEETSRYAESRNRWGMRRRTRSTGNLPCAPQPTEDSSSSPVDQLDINTSSPKQNRGNMIQSDSDDRETLAFSFRSRQVPIIGNFESDSFNENFSPTRPSIRRKRKFKRIAVGYETSISSSNMTNNSIFPIIVKKRVHDNLRFLQNEKQQVLTLFNMNAAEHDKLHDLSKLYSLTMQVENGCIILNKTSNTMQSIRVDHINLPKNLGDFKRRCYGEAEDVDLDTCQNSVIE